MPEHIRALIVIGVLSVAVFWFARSAITERGMSQRDFVVRRNLWFAVTLIAFVSHNFWVCMVALGLLLLIAGTRDRNPVALFCFLLFAMPAYPEEIPGFGIVNYLFELSYVRLLVLAILLPMALRLRRERHERSAGYRLPDFCVLGYIALIFIMQMMGETSLTNSLRAAFDSTVDVGLPYYVASRAIRRIEDIREIMAAFVVAAAVMAVIAMFETSRYWLLYDGVRPALGLPAPFFLTYLTRGIGGLLRATASTLHPIVLGYVMMVALSMLMFFLKDSKYRLQLTLAGLCLLGGMVASLSRGPWVGAAAVLAMIVALEPKAGKRFAWLFGAASTIAIAFFVSPYGPVLMDYLPFVGNIESGNIDYRTQLWELSQEVIRQNPWFGDLNFLSNPILEPLRQGQGIIDIVNTYLDVALEYGLVGLGMFLMPFAYAIRSVWTMRRVAIANGNDEAERISRVLFAAIVGTLLTIATVSSINLIPFVYWILIGVCIGASRVLVDKPVAETRRAVRVRRNSYSGLRAS
jgi:hypothetical protein